VVTHNKLGGRSRCGRKAGRVRQSNGVGTLRAQWDRGTFRPQLENLLDLRVVNCSFSRVSHFSNVRTYLITVLI